MKKKIIQTCSGGPSDYVEMSKILILALKVPILRTILQDVKFLDFGQKSEKFDEKQMVLGATSIDKIGEVRLSDEIGGGGV